MRFALPGRPTSTVPLPDRVRRFFGGRPAVSPAELLARDVHLAEDVDEEGLPRTLLVKPGATAKGVRAAAVMDDIVRQLDALAIRTALAGAGAGGAPLRCVVCDAPLWVDGALAQEVVLVAARPIVLAHAGDCFERAAAHRSPADLVDLDPNDVLQALRDADGIADGAADGAD